MILHGGKAQGSLGEPEERKIVAELTVESMLPARVAPVW